MNQYLNIKILTSYNSLFPNMKIFICLLLAVLTVHGQVILTPDQKNTWIKWGKECGDTAGLTAATPIDLDALTDNALNFVVCFTRKTGFSDILENVLDGVQDEDGDEAGTPTPAPEGDDGDTDAPAPDAGAASAPASDPDAGAAPAPDAGAEPTPAPEPAS